MEKKLRRMSRTELIEIIYAQQQREQFLTEKTEELTGKLNDRNIKLEKSGSIAEAALRLNNIFEDAQAAAEEYLQSVCDADEQSGKMIAAAKEEAGLIITSARIEADNIVQQGRREAEAEKKKFMKTASALLMEYPELAKAMKIRDKGG